MVEIAGEEVFVVRLGGRTDIELLKKRLTESGFLVETGETEGELIIHSTAIPSSQSQAENETLGS